MRVFLGIAEPHVDDEVAEAFRYWLGNVIRPNDKDLVHSVLSTDITPAISAVYGEFRVGLAITPGSSPSGTQYRTWRRVTAEVDSAVRNGMKAAAFFLTTDEMKAVVQQGGARQLCWPVVDPHYGVNFLGSGHDIQLCAYGQYWPWSGRWHNVPLPVLP